MKQYWLDANLWLGKETLDFLLQVVLRSTLMFIVILVGLRILGKRGVKQLSVFELVVIIGLGSAAGDPMFYKDVGLLPAIVVFITIVILYKVVTRMVARFPKIERLVEGRPICLIKDGLFCLEDIEKQSVAQDEFFAELRSQGISQLGQVHRAYVETSGEISVFYRKDKDVSYGLPLLPEDFKSSEQITERGFYSCSFCGFTHEFEEMAAPGCPRCKKEHWVKSNKDIRIT